MSNTGPEADDLDDGLAYEFDLSGDENDNGIMEGEEHEVEVNGGDNDDQLIKTGGTSKDYSREKNDSKKRKRDDSSLKEKKKIKMEMDTEQKKNISLEENADVIAEFINSRIRRKHASLSALELSELFFSKSDIRTTHEFKEPRTLDNLGSYINQRFKNMLPGKQGKQSKQAKQVKQNKKKLKNSGNNTEENVDDKGDFDNHTNEDRKFIAIVSMSAIRACDVHRATKDLNGGSLKLINKNKLAVDLKLVGSTRSRILCCTPGRLSKVLDAENSKLAKEEVKIVLVDNSYLDQKKQNIWDIKETVEVLKDLTKSGSKLYFY